MKIKLNDNLPTSLVHDLGGLGHDVHTVHDECLEEHVDDRIWQATQSEGRFLITQDLDFSDVRRFKPGSHGGILLVRLHEPGRRALTAAVRQVFAGQDVSGWQGCFIILTEHVSLVS